jgi:hypothetical protein
MFAGFPAGLFEFTVCRGLRQRDLFSEFARLPAADRMDGIRESAMIPEVDHESFAPQRAAREALFDCCYSWRQRRVGDPRVAKPMVVMPGFRRLMPI